jgi:PAS domain S-box-containing protein
MGPLAKIFSTELTQNSSLLKLWVWNVAPTESPFELPEAHIESFEAGNIASILNSLSDGIILTDLGGRVKVFNRTAIRLMGLGTLEPDSTGWLEKAPLFYPDRRTRIKYEDYPSHRAIRGEAVKGFEVFLIPPDRPDGVFIEIDCSTIKDDSGKIHGAISVLRDVTQRKLEEEKVHQNKIRFETLAHLVNDVVFEWFAKPDITLRHGVRKAFGYPEDIVDNGHQWWKDKIHPDDLPRVGAVFERVMNEGQDVWSIEYRFRKADSTFAYVIDHGKVLAKDTSGRPEHILGAMIDITQRRQEEEKLSFLATLVDSTDDAVFSVDFSGMITSWNRGAQRMYGYTAAEMINRSSSVLLVQGFEEKKCLVDQAIQNGVGIKRDEALIKTKIGEIIETSATISPVRNSQNEIIGCCVVARDITEYKKASEKIEKLAANLSRSNEELKAFAYLASHDLREPLRTVSSFLTLVKNNPLVSFDSKTLEYINFAVEGVTRMKRLVDTLLEYSTAEHSSFHFRPVDCDLIVNQVRHSLKVVIEETRAEIIVENLPTINGDDLQLTQLFQNLISNAIKYSGEKSPRIRVGATPTEVGWQFFISDRGIGIDPKFKNQIFNVFKRLHSRREYPGAGLGLAICKKIVERHGGQIWFESGANSGTTFFFSIPRKYFESR